MITPTLVQGSALQCTGIRECTQANIMTYTLVVLDYLEMSYYVSTFTLMSLLVLYIPYPL